MLYDNDNDDDDDDDDAAALKNVDVVETVFVRLGRWLCCVVLCVVGVLFVRTVIALPSNYF